ncbi:MAG: glycoside hydrolase family 130 protein [Actinomycetota bacterium]
MEPQRTGIVLRPDEKRVFFRAFEPSDDRRILKLFGRVMAMSDTDAEELADEVLAEFGDRHSNLSDFFEQRYEIARRHRFSDLALGEAKRILLGAHLTQEYALEAAALFNPSMVAHPDQTGVPDGSIRFIASLRATGEGHVSSITFREGLVDSNGMVHIDEPSRYVAAGRIEPLPDYQKGAFSQKMFELGFDIPFTRTLLDELSDEFTFPELESVVNRARRGDRNLAATDRQAADAMINLARSNYSLHFDPDQAVSERVMFPAVSIEGRGMEDARFVEFIGEHGEKTYYGTYTAYDGHNLFTRLIETRDFINFKVNTLFGSQIENKGMALFPRKVNGKYAMISRQDNENLYLMYSDRLHFWDRKEILLRPTFPWEFVQVGNCGSPIETDAGWLIITHGVGAMRKYVIGAALLDLDDPSQVIGRLPDPLLSPNEAEREGYVPNVVYSCGSMVHQGRLVVPYAMSDQCSTFATFDLDELVENLLKAGPDGSGLQPLALSAGTD